MSEPRDDLPRDAVPTDDAPVTDPTTEPMTDDVHADAAAYALDALEPAERDAFEEHLATCARCQQEVSDLQGVAAALVLDEPVPPPPPGLRAAVLASVRDVEQLAPEPEPVEHAPGPRLVTADERPAAWPRRAAPADADPWTDELALRRANRRTRLLSALVAAVTVVALALGVSVWGLVRRQPPVAGPAPTVTATATVPQVDPSLLAAPDVRILPTTVNGVSASFVVSKSQDRAVFVSADLPAPPAGSVYHLWTLEGTTVRPDNTFATGGSATQELSGPVDASTNLAINLEPQGTDPQAPTTPVLGIVDL